MPDECIFEATGDEVQGSRSASWPRAVPLARVLAVADPLVDNPWDTMGEPVTAELVAKVGQMPPCEHEPLDTNHDTKWMAVMGCAKCEARQIARFVADGAPADDPHPVMLDFGCLDYEPLWPIIDGNHRVAAAKIRGDETIVVDVAGDMDAAEAALLGALAPSEMDA